MRRLLIIISSACLAFLFVITYYFFSSPVNNSPIHLEERMISGAIDDDINFMQQAYFKNGQSLDFLVENIEGKQDSIKQLTGEKRKLVLRYSNINCNICIDSAVSEMKIYSNLIGNNNMLLMIDDINAGDFQRLASKNTGLEISVYRILENDTQRLTIPSDYPYLFMLDSSLIMKDVFFPIKSKPEYSRMYYETMYEKYFKDIAGGRSKQP